VSNDRCKNRDRDFFHPAHSSRKLRPIPDKAKSLEPVKIALALDCMEFEVFHGGNGYMRKDDHQFFQPMYIASFGEIFLQIF
jgi:branched-chain amino acid transport system substrate-binding protein